MSVVSMWPEFFIDKLFFLSVCLISVSEVTKFQNSSRGCYNRIKTGGSELRLCVASTLSAENLGDSSRLHCHRPPRPSTHERRDFVCVVKYSVFIHQCTGVC